ncbi:MAG: transglycosylase domain-containing protein [Ignavibacteriae bacterium]|nr:transglycosylase domain-containing protein [Ignavibacteriota bacterium]MCB9221895.1 transglycosylase domain-containing protein [Ignavibacteria bacterium]
MTPKLFLILLITITLVVACGVSIYFYSVISTGLPSLQQLENPEQMYASQIMSSDDEIIDHFYMQRRVNLRLDQMPQSAIDALISTEDRKFYSHWGIDLDRLMKAVLKKILNPFSRAEGASTITQQLARNLFLDLSRNVERKIREAAVTVKIEDTYTKDEILEMYLNTVNFGRGSYGISVAAHTFFDKDAKDLSIAESAYLIGVLKAPSRYDVRTDYNRALRRRNLVLSMMLSQDKISYAEYKKAIETPIEVQEGNAGSVTESMLAPHFVETIRKEYSPFLKEKDYDLYKDGLIIYTTLNEKIQQYTNDAVKKHLSEYQEKFDNKWNWKYHKKLEAEIISEAIRKNPEYRSAPKSERESIAKRLRKDNRFIDSVKNEKTTIQIGVVVIDPSSGAILSLVGASPQFMKENTHSKHSLNHISQIRRQPGSSMKPFVYAMALKNGLYPNDSIGCGPFVYRDPNTNEIWAPRSGTNDCPDTTYKMTLANGLRMSVNSVAARLITEYTSPTEVKDLLRKSGITSPIQAVPALALGAGGELVPLELISAFSIFANDGYRVEPYYVNRIEDRNGNLIFRKKRTNKIYDVLDKEIAHEMTLMLQEVVNQGTAARIRSYFQNIEAAGKTGTTNDNSDAWFIGYTPQLICGIWVGFDDHRINFNAIGADGQGGRLAGPIWGMIMNNIYNDGQLPYKQTSFGYKSRKELDSLSKLQREVSQYLDIINN